MDTVQNNKQVRKNYIYNVAYQLLLIIVPLIVTPYISRKLLPNGIGMYSFSFSLITYFTIFAALGFGAYAQREIAKYRNNIDVQSKIFWEVIICRFFSVMIALAVNFLLLYLNVYGDYSILMLILSINIFAIIFDVAFVFQGNEKFSTIVLLNSLIRITGVICIFLFVKNPNDLWK